MTSKSLMTSSSKLDCRFFEPRFEWVSYAFVGVMAFDKLVVVLMWNILSESYEVTFCLVAFFVCYHTVNVYWSRLFYEWVLVVSHLSLFIISCVEEIEPRGTPSTCLEFRMCRDVCYVLNGSSWVFC